ncbi:solute carrier organic anion transporter family member 3A1-like [Ptychodera flava]|uniref:solute carrier organic anion transporter family member 3A1-like n=1 Tax=Ptychodera flava TaxID=63121 RepID=UPI00396A8273
MNYYSPCYAGCSSSVTATNFTDCLCINSEDPTSTYVQNGLCSRPLCQYFVLFLVILAVFSIANSGMSLPTTMVTVRCVDKKQKSFALGLKHIISTLFRVPATILGGAIMDSTCILWREKCDEKGACAQYDNTLYRVAILAMAAAFSVVALVMLTAQLIILVRRNRKHKLNDSVDGCENNRIEGRLHLQNTATQTLECDNQGFKENE